MSLRVGRSGRLRATAGVAVIGVVAALAAAGCGSSSSSSSSTSSATPGTSQAQKMLQAASARPTSIGITTPINKPIPAGKKVAYISCGVGACQAQAKIIAQGAKDLGWTATTIGTDGSPQQVQAAFESALRQGANAVIVNGLPRALLEKQIAEAQKKGVVFEGCCMTDPVGNGILYSTSTPPQNAEIGKQLAAQIVADSGGKANTLYVNIPAYAVLGQLGTSLKTTYKRLCPTCGFASIDIPLTSLGKDAPDRIVSYLRSHPDVNYVALSVSDALGVGLPAALQAAGLGDKVKIVGQGGNEQVFQYMSQGKVQALVPFDYYTVDYLMLDALARHWAGVPVKATPPPYWLMKKSALPSSNTLFPVVTNYRQQFLKLWGKRAA